MNGILQNVILTILTIVLFAGLKYLTEYTNANKDKIKDERVKLAIDKALEIVTLAVNITNQEFVDKLKEEGAFEEDRAEEAFNSTKKLVIKMLTDETKSILEEEFKNLNEFLNDVIVGKVRENKK